MGAPACMGHQGLCSPWPWALWLQFLLVLVQVYLLLKGQKMVMGAGRQLEPLAVPQSLSAFLGGSSEVVTAGSSSCAMGRV